MSIRAAMSLVVPVAFAVYALAIHAEEAKTTDPTSEQQAAKPKPKPSSSGGGHVKPFDGATGAQASGAQHGGWDVKANKTAVTPAEGAPDKGGWDQKKGQGGIANPEPKPDEAMLLPAVQKVREAAARSK